MPKASRVHSFAPCLIAGFPTPQRTTPIKRKHNVQAQAAAAESQKDDVAIYDTRTLEEGVRKHTISIFVADESGLINRVAGVFARRGANIESLAVGLTVDKALFSIVATGTEGTVANLCKQLAKLVNVRFVEDITDTAHIERELVLIKVRAPAGPARTEITQLSQIFRAHIVDVGAATFTMAVTGDPGKVAAFQNVLTKFGVVQVVRTGRIALKRGEALFNDGESSGAYNNFAGNGASAGQGVASSAGRASPLDSVHDVYAGGSSDDEGVWNVYNVLDASYSPTSHHHVFEACTLSIDVQDVPGVLNQVTGVVSRRSYNVQSLAVGNSEKEGMSRITMVVPGEADAIEKLKKQLLKLVYVHSVTELHAVPHVARELMLVKVACSPGQRGEILDLARIFHGSVCDVSRSTVTLEVTGKEDKMRALQDVLEPYGILEIARTGRVALERESGVDSRYLSNIAGARVML